MKKPEDKKNDFYPALAEVIAMWLVLVVMCAVIYSFAERYSLFEAYDFFCKKVEIWRKSNL
jgi:hypothetical protein